MRADIGVRPAEPADAQQIVDVMRRVFDPVWLDMSIYACSGVADFVREQISARGLGGDTIHVVATYGDRIVAAAEARSNPNGLFLGYIAVLPEFQSIGIGRRMLVATVQTARPGGAGDIVLDVLDVDGGARAWYQRLGLADQAQGGWWVLPRKQAGESAEGVLCGYPQTMACYRRFGFAELKLRTHSREYSVGMLNRGWFRLTQPEALSDPEVWAALRRLDPSRQVFAILPDPAPVALPADARLLARYYRMASPIDELTPRITAAGGVVA